VGSVLKSELFRGSSESEPNISCPQSVKMHPRQQDDAFNSMNMELFPPFNPGDLRPNQELSSTLGQRRKSIGKKLVSKAFDGLGNARSKSMHFLHPKSSKDSLLRQVSLRNLESSRQISFEMSSRNSSRFSFEQESVLIRHSRSNSVLCPNELLLLPAQSFVLYPEITVIPEIDTVDFGNEVSFWVAILVTGVLRETTNCDMIPESLLTSQSSSTSQDMISTGKQSQPRPVSFGLLTWRLDSTSYGYLYDVDITLAARKGCVLESVIAEQDQPRLVNQDRVRCSHLRFAHVVYIRRLHLGQTELTLAKLKLLVGRRSSSHVRESSKKLIAELESRLGNATTKYLTIGISYKHSAFPTSRSSTAAFKGLSYHTTTMRIEAHAVIKLHCSESSWSRQTSENQDSSVVPNPLLSSIIAHCSPAKAARLISKITPDPVPLAEVARGGVDTARRRNSSSDTITPIRRISSGEILHQAAQLDNSISMPAPKQSLDITQAGFHDTDCNLGTLALNPCSDPDPARKIWLDMRKTSRGTVKRASRATESLDMDVDGGTRGSNEAELNVQKEQARIMELALRNKRSLGADTLRSMTTPSMSMGLGVGRGWGWGPPWW
jgi:hypothetical protein